MRCFLVSLFICLIIKSANAQEAKTYLVVYGDVSIPVGDFGDLYKMGYGGQVKLLRQVNEDNAITITTGISFYTIKLRYTTDDERQTYRVIPLLAGYRHQIKDFIIEGSAGIGAYQMRHEFKDEKTINWHTSFTSAIRLGYIKYQYEMGIRYQTGLKKDDNVSLIVLSVGYHFNISRKGS